MLKGSIPFLAELMKHIKCDLEVDFMQASSYVGVKSSGAVMVLKDMITPVVGRHLLIVEDIVDTGLTLQEVMNLLSTGALPALKSSRFWTSLKEEKSKWI